MSNMALVLTGGGARAAYQAGAIRAIYEICKEQGHPFFDIYCGTSAGAINASFLAGEGHCPDKATMDLCSLWSKLDPQMIFRTDPVHITTIGTKWITGLMLGGFFAGGTPFNYLLDTSPLKRLIEKRFNQKQLQINIKTNMVKGLSITTTNYYSGANISFLQSSTPIEGWERTDRLGVAREITPAHILASASIPVFFPPVSLENNFHGDGSIRQLAPMGPAIRLGAKKILAIGVRHGRPISDTIRLSFEEKKMTPHIAQIAGGLLNSIFLDSINYDIERMNRINQIVDQAQKNSAKIDVKKVPVKLFSPSRDIGIMAGGYLKELPPLMRFLFSSIGVTETEGTDLLSYLAFDHSYTAPLIDLGHSDIYNKKDQLIEFLSSME